MVDGASGPNRTAPDRRRLVRRGAGANRERVGRADVDYVDDLFAWRLRPSFCRVNMVRSADVDTEQPRPVGHRTACNCCSPVIGTTRARC